MNADDFNIYLITIIITMVACTNATIEKNNNIEFVQNHMQDYITICM